MEIAKLYETAAEKLDKAIEVCEKSNINLTSITVIAASSGNIYSATNWKRLNDAFEEEETHSEDEALAKMLLAGETAVEHIVTLDANTKLPVDPYQKSLELLIKINSENAKCSILQGKNSKVVLTSVNSDIAKFAEQIAAEEAKNRKAETPVENTAPTPDQNQNAAAAPQPPVTPGAGEPEGSAAHAGIDASGLQMIFDDWESSADKQDGNESKPFNGQSLSSSQADKAEVINQVQNMANNGYPGGQMQGGMYQQQNMNGGQMQNGMYGGQGMNGMYGGQQMQGGMYQQQSMNGGQMQNGMYGGQGMNGMYGGQQMQGGMYGQGMNGMYGGQMNGMYGGPMNGMYGGQMYGQQSMYGAQGGAYGQQPGGGRQSLYLNPGNAQGAQGVPGQQSVYTMPGSATSSYRSKLQAPVHSSVVNTQSVSVYGTNIGEGDNNAIFKDRLADILNSSSAAGKPDENDKTEVMMSAREKKNAAKKDAKHH
ncbi:MAG: hypothetical protein IKN85_06880 [Oscillospiraceae bacterium]|nr:hypothetical protein [Oscillospiraceae bacterium]